MPVAVIFWISIFYSTLKDTLNIDGQKFFGAKYAKCDLRLAMFPTLAFSSLFESLCELIPLAHLITNNYDGMYHVMLVAPMRLSMFEFYFWAMSWGLLRIYWTKCLKKLRAKSMKYWRNYNHYFWFLTKYKILNFMILEKN